MKLFSTEQVSRWHPDKVCDQISDAILDACLKQDKRSHVACETMFKGTTVVLGGEITTEAKVEYADVALRTAAKLGYKCDRVINMIENQSPEINQGIGDEGAGDQGMMYGYACNDTESKLPYGFDLANRIIASIEDGVTQKDSPLLGDAKCQVTVDLSAPPDIESVEKVLVSVCHKEGYSRDHIRRYITSKLFDLGIDDGTVDICVNPAGAWTIGGPAADCGLTGRKIVCDQYGGYCAVGGGAFSGKDPSKVDRSAAYMARALACHYVDAFNLKDCEVQLAYAIGLRHPVSVSVRCRDLRGGDNPSIARIIEHEVENNFDLSPSGIIRRLDLLKPRYEEIAAGCHYREDFWRV